MLNFFFRFQVPTIRQMFHRLCIHVIQKLRSMQKDSYLLPWVPHKDPDDQPDAETRARIGSAAPITRFVRMLLSLFEPGGAANAKPHLKCLTELFRDVDSSRRR